MIALSVLLQGLAFRRRCVLTKPCGRELDLALHGRLICRIAEWLRQMPGRPALAATATGHSGSPTHLGTPITSDSADLLVFE
jgi:hypothetical protein